MATLNPPKSLPGLPAEAQRAILDYLRQLTEAYQELAKGRLEVLDRRAATTIRPRPGELVRASSGQAVVLPAPRPSRGQEIVVLVESAPITVLAETGSVNGSASGITVPTLGAVVLRSTGEQWWAGAAGGVTGAGAPPDADYFVGTAHAALTAERVAADTAEIEVNTATAGAVSWRLRDGSVALGRLANVNDDTFLGRRGQGAAGAPIAETIASLAGVGLAFDGASGAASSTLIASQGRTLYLDATNSPYNDLDLSDYDVVFCTADLTVNGILAPAEGVAGTAASHVSGPDKMFICSSGITVTFAYNSSSNVNQSSRFYLPSSSALVITDRQTASFRWTPSNVGQIELFCRWHLVSAQQFLPVLWDTGGSTSETLLCETLHFDTNFGSHPGGIDWSLTNFSGRVSVQGAANGIQDANIATDAAIDLSKLADISDNQVLDNISGASAPASGRNWSDVTGDGITFNTTTHQLDWGGLLVKDQGVDRGTHPTLNFLQTDHIDWAIVNDAVSGENEVQANIRVSSIDTPEIADDAVDGDKIADSAISNVHVAAAAAIALSKLATVPVTGVQTQVFATPGQNQTWHKPENHKFSIIILTGGGGGGGSADSDVNGESAAGGGGGAGGTLIAVLSTGNFTSTCSVDVGAGGAGGADSGDAGGVGGQSNFSLSGEDLSIGGGQGGIGETSGSPTGTAVGGSGGGQIGTRADVYLPGGEGHAGVWFVADGKCLAIGGAGGASFWGQGAHPEPLPTDNIIGPASKQGTDAVAPGSGGSGGANNNSLAFGIGGGDGAGGICLAIDFF